MSILGFLKKGIKSGRRHKGKVTGGIGYEPQKSPKPSKVKKAATKSQLKARRVSLRKHKRIAKRIWRKLI
jgi:hypothetical protein